MRRSLAHRLHCATFGLALALGSAAFIVALPVPVAAQELPDTNPDADLILSADELIYDNNSKIVTARGAVQMRYDGYNVVARRVSYNQRTRRVKAYGAVEVVEPDGNRIYAEELDLSDDFGNGFVNALRVETPDNTRFAAESAERQAGRRTVFHNGVYTACEVCAENPQRPPLWQIKSEKVVLDGVEKTVTYRNATFEIFGQPIAYLPYFRHPDPTVKRKRGFLFPTGGFSEHLGYFYRQSYFIPTSRSTDLTLTGSYYNQQGFLSDVRWRQQMENGYYSIRSAGVRQQKRKAFPYAPDNEKEWRGMVAGHGRFNINPRWSWGWDVLAQTDSNFSRTYDITNWDNAEQTNEVFLKGLANRSYFELAAQQYLVQPRDTVDPSRENYGYFYDKDQQALLLPNLDYNYETVNAPVEGLVSFDVNVQNIHRQEQNLFTENGADELVGLDGNSTRLSAKLGWKRTLKSAGGLLLTPELAVRGDWLNVDEKTTSLTPRILDGNDSRFLATAGLTASYPLLITGPASSHVLEPIAQIYARPDVENDAWFVNEDSRSLVFDTTNLLRDNKFSGYDRVEEGVRANLALRYGGSFANGLSLDAMIGQSYHLAGENAYARFDGLTNTGIGSGLDTDVSDVVTSVSLQTGSSLVLNNENRFESGSFDLQRATISTIYNGSAVQARMSYTHIAAQPALRYNEDRKQIGGRISYDFAENWKVSAGAEYDLQDEHLIADVYGLAYADECYTFSLNFKREHAESGEVSRSIGFKFGFRTLGDFGYSIGEPQLSSFDTSGFFGG